MTDDRSPRVVPLQMTPDAFRRAGHELVDRLADGLARIPDGPVTPGESPRDVQAALDAGAPLPEAGCDAGALLQEAAALLFGHSLFNGHPRFFGYITSSPAPVGMLADLLAAAVNANVGSWRLGPMATEIEAQTVRWIAELVGYPASGGGLLVSGGNMANIVPVLAARRAAASWDLRADGVAAPDAKPLRIYAPRRRRTPGCRRPPTSAGWAPAPFGGSPSTARSACASTCSAQPSSPTARPARCRWSSWARAAR